MFDLRICEIDNARRMIEEGWPTHILSLVSPRTRMESTGPNHTVLRMNDVSMEGYGGPTREHVDEIILFARQLNPNAKVLVHCLAGQSRSTAAAIIIGLCWGGSARASFDWVQAIRPILLPNALLIHYADDRFGLDGELRRIVAAFTNDQLRVINAANHVKPELAKADIALMQKFMDIEIGDDEDSDSSVPDPEDLKKEAALNLCFSFLEAAKRSDQYEVDYFEAATFITSLADIICNEPVAIKFNF